MRDKAVWVGSFLTMGAGVEAGGGGRVPTTMNNARPSTVQRQHPNKPTAKTRVTSTKRTTHNPYPHLLLYPSCHPIEICNNWNISTSCSSVTIKTNNTRDYHPTASPLKSTLNYSRGKCYSCFVLRKPTTMTITTTIPTPTPII